MNKVSWRRILQRAGHEFPNETGAAIIPMQDAHRLARHGSHSPREPKAGVLESELKRTLDRAARREHEFNATRTPPGWEPLFMAARGTGGAARGTGGGLREISDHAPLPAVRIKPQPAKPSSSSGGRNILAICLSAAVVGIAYQQISTEWNQSRATGSGVGAAPGAANSPANALYSSALIDDSQAGYGVQSRGEETQLAPPHPAVAEDVLAPAAGEAKQSDAFLPVEQSTSVLVASRPQHADPVTPVSAPIKDADVRELVPNAISAAEEQSMLRRAHELIERGHLSGARLIFEHLALQQSALGAFALAETYDEKFLKTLHVEGQQADLALAEKWYRRAAELGAQSADRH